MDCALRALHVAFAVPVDLAVTARITMTKGDHDLWWIAPFVFFGLLILGVGFLAWLNYKTQEGFGLTRVTSLSAGEVIDRLVGSYTVNGWQVPSLNDRSATMYRRSGPSLLLTLVLFALGILPGLLYLLFGGGDDLTVAVTTRPQQDGSIEVDVVGNSHSDGSFQIAKEVLDALP